MTATTMQTNGGNGEGAHLLALVDISPGCAQESMEELATAAHAASRRGTVVFVTPHERRAELEQVLSSAARRAGLHGLRVRIVAARDEDAALAPFTSIELVVSDDPAAIRAALGEEPRELLPVGAGLRRLRELGRDPVMTGPDPIFRPLTVRRSG